MDKVPSVCIRYGTGPAEWMELKEHGGITLRHRAWAWVVLLEPGGGLSYPSQLQCCTIL